MPTVDLTPWAPAIALGGVLVGVVVTFVGQWLTRRQTSALSISEQKAALRNDRREAIFAFIDVAQGVYVIADPREYGEPIEIDDEVRAVDHQLWFRQKCIDVLCSDEFRAATRQYAGVLYWILWEPIPKGSNLYDFADTEQKKFYELARKELYAPKVSD